VKRYSAVPQVWAFGLLLYVVVVAVPGQAVQPLALHDYFATALKRSEYLATQAELIQQAEERYKQAGAALLPNIYGYASYTWAEEPPPDVSITSSTASRQPLARLSATQPLFRGFREFAAIRQSKALREAQDEDYQNARVLLYKDVVQNFYTVLSLERDLTNYQEEIKQNMAREKEIAARLRIGRSRESELLNVQATLSTLRAQVELLKGQLRVAREAFAFFSGLEADTPLRDTEVLQDDLNAMDNYLAGIAERPDVKAAEQRYTAAKENINVAQGAHLPTLDLNGNYYLDRPANLNDINWDVQVALNIPLYSGGATQSRVREAASQRNQAEYVLEQVRRQAEQEIRALYQSVQFDRTQLAALERAAQATKKSYEAQRREYRLGLVTNLDVLQALTAFQQNQRALDRARYTAKANYLTLLAAAARGQALEKDSAP